MRNQTRTETQTQKQQTQLSKRQRIFRIALLLSIFVLVPTLIAIALGFYTRGYFAVGGELILPLLGVFCLSRVEIEP